MSQEQTKKWVRMNGVATQYAIKNKVGRGTFGTVFKASAVKGNKQYAIKKLENNDPKMVAQGFPITALRQIMLLKQINHPNIVKLHQIIASKPSKNNLYRGSTFLVFQYMHHDLAGLIKSKARFTLPELKCISKQILQGINYLHSMRILHRDIKSANILFNKDGEIKIGDFGLGRKYRPDISLTHKVVTLWYRAPELILASRYYDYKIDVWSIGCVLAQLFTGEILFRKQTEFAQLQRIFQIMGDYDYNKVPSQVLAKFASLKQMLPSKSYNRQFESHMKKLNPEIGEDAISLLSGMLDLNPNKRLTCQEALNHPFFTNSPVPCKPNQIQKFPHEMKQFFRENSCRIQYEQKEEKRKRQDDKRHYDSKYEHRHQYRNDRNDRYRYKDRYYEKNRHDQQRRSNSKDRHKNERRDEKEKQRKHRSHSENSYTSHRNRSREKYHKRNNEDQHFDKKHHHKENREHNSRHDYHHRSEKNSDHSYREDNRRQRQFDKDAKSSTKQQHQRRYRNQNDYSREERDHRKDKYQNQKKQKNYRERKDYRDKDEAQGQKYKDDGYRKKQQRSYRQDERRYRQNRDDREIKPRNEKYDRDSKRYEGRSKDEKSQRNEKVDRYEKEDRYDSKSQKDKDEDFRQKKYYVAQKIPHRFDRQGSGNNNSFRGYRQSKEDRHRGYREQRGDDKYREHSHSLKRGPNQYRQRSRQKKSRSRDRNQRHQKPTRSNEFPVQQKKEGKPQKQKEPIQDDIEY